MAWRFLVIDGYDQGSVFPLARGKATIGNRRKDSSITLHDLLVAPLHCEVSVDDDHVILVQHEKARSQGTYVNGQKVEEQELHLGDVVRIGNSYLRLESGEPAPEPLPSRDDGPLPTLPREQLEGLTGRVLGHFQIGPLLGKGHTGATFRAHDRKADRVVALKVLGPEFPQDDAEMQCFVRALKVALPLRHENLVTLYGAGKSGPYCWIAREYVEGESLAQVIQRRNEAARIDWRRACRVAVHVARALRFLREHHVQHTNVTPQNILIQGEEQVAKLADVMMVKALEGSHLQQSVLEHKLLSELAYMAPEQVDPDAFVDDLVDLYNLGTVVYALLTGRPAFGGDAPEEIIANIQAGEVTRPSRYQKGIPEEFERIILRMLAKQQLDRYQSPADLLQELEDVAQGHDVEV